MCGWPCQKSLPTETNTINSEIVIIKLHPPKQSLCSSKQGLLHVPFVWPPLGRTMLFRLWDPRAGMVSLLSFASFLGPYLSRSFLTWRLLSLAVLESGAPLSSFLEGALYKCSIFHFLQKFLQQFLGNDRVNIFYRVANSNIWMYYLPDPGMNRASIICLHF